MGMAIDAVGFLLVLGSIPLAFGILKLATKDESIEFVSFIGERSTLYAFVGLVLLLVVPYGAFIVLPIVVALSFASPAGRLDWTEFRNRRLMAGLLVLLMLGASGFMPTDAPRAPEEWGEPFARRTPTHRLGPAVSSTPGFLLNQWTQPILKLYRV